MSCRSILLAPGILIFFTACTGERPVAADYSDPSTVRIPGLKQKVEILRDRWGVPHIYAQNADDLFLANGRCREPSRQSRHGLEKRAHFLADHEMDGR